MKTGPRIFVIDSEYVYSHGRRPRGRATWGFKIDGREKILWGAANATFTEARSMAVWEAKRIHAGETGTFCVVVCP